MKDNMNELVKFSPFGGTLVLETVKGDTSGVINPENNVDTEIGMDRDMYAYIPASGCPHAKQAQVLMVLRNENTLESAEKLMKDLSLDKLAEERHFILLFPNPLDHGWNYNNNPKEDDDKQFLVRCFAALPKSKGKVAGFNGMIFYIGTTSESSALLTNLATTSPMNVAAMMIGEYPADYTVGNAAVPQVCWLYQDNELAREWLQQVNAPVEKEADYYRNQENANIKYWQTNNGLNAQEVEDAWDRMFSETRRWRNDVYGTYQKRINFTEKGFVAHVNDTSLGDNDNFPHTWYEYVPEHLRNTDKKLPLVLYFHGINCISLYGAEQSMWSDIAEREGFITCFPDPSIEERWNVWDDPRIPSDVQYVLALIKHLKETYPVDESRIYISGFSMGSMFTNALANSYPEVFAGAVANNAPDQGYLLTLEESVAGLRFFRSNTVLNDLVPNGETESPTKRLTDEKKKNPWRMPFVQFAGIQDNVGFPKGEIYPIKESQKGNMWIGTIKLWKELLGIADGEFYDENSLSGLKSDLTKEYGRFVHQSWKNEDGEELYHFILVKNMPHAVDLENFEIGWRLVKDYYRNSDGSLGKD